MSYDHEDYTASQKNRHWVFVGQRTYQTKCLSMQEKHNTTKTCDHVLVMHGHRELNYMTVIQC